MKWFGQIGYEYLEETEPGVYEAKILVRDYYGDITRNYKKDQSQQMINNNYAVNNQVAVIADPYAFNNFHKIVYITFMGTKWRPSAIEVQYPRLIFELGSIYNEEEGGSDTLWQVGCNYSKS